MGNTLTAVVTGKVAWYMYRRIPCFASLVLPYPVERVDLLPTRAREAGGRHNFKRDIVPDLRAGEFSRRQQLLNLQLRVRLTRPLAWRRANAGWHRPPGYRATPPPTSPRYLGTRFTITLDYRHMCVFRVRMTCVCTTKLCRPCVWMRC